MHIVVCIKQVPDSAQIRVHPVTNTIMRQGVPAIVNPYDLFALEEALRLKDQFGGRVTVLCMGPPQAEDALRKCVSLRRRRRDPGHRPRLRRRRHAGHLLRAGLGHPHRSSRTWRWTWSSPASRPSTATPPRSAPASPSASDLQLLTYVSQIVELDLDERADHGASAAPKAACRC